jgi:hypothetical protein
MIIAEDSSSQLLRQVVVESTEARNDDACVT